MNLKKILKKTAAVLMAAVCAAVCAACQTTAGTSSSAAAVSSAVANAGSSGAAVSSSEALSLNTDTSQAPVIDGLTCRGSLPLTYAKCFSVWYYTGGYALIAIDDGRSYLLVPEGGSIPKNLPSSYIVLQQPLDRIYLAATAAMCQFDSLGAVDHVLLSGLEADEWYVDSAKAALQAGTMLYAGKYSAPDYELLIRKQCCLAIESTMILHTPEVQKKLEELDIPVMIERSSYETEPMGRAEWVKLYGVLTGREAQAEASFAEQEQYVAAVSTLANTEKTVAFFSVNANGQVSVRRGDDYLPRMIEIAGGRYIFPNLTGSSNTITMGMEDFYAGAKDADYIIYNATIAEPLTSVAELVAKSPLFADFKAVQEGHVWTTDKSMYQSSNVTGTIINDIHLMLTGDTDQAVYLKKLN